MSLNETYNKLNKELQQNVKIEIEKAEKGKSKKSLSQLQLILSELEKSYDTPNVNLSFPNQVKDTIDIILEDYYQCNTNYSFIGDDDYKSITFIYDENISESLETKVLGAVFAKYAYLNVLEHKDPNWKIHLQIYNCHTNKLVIEGDLEKERVSWSQDDWARSYE